MDTVVWYIRERFQMTWTVVRESLKSSDVVFGALLIVIWGSCIREPVEVRILEELLTVINSCVLNFECNKVPL
jgi:hypothetical protein